MRHSQNVVVALACAVALSLAACASGSADPPPSPGADAPTASSPAPAAEPAPAATASEAATAALTGVVGTDDDPEAYVIELLDASGAPVESLAAGTYALTFADRSSTHNFRLRGPGGVDVATEVAGSDESTIEVTLEPGTYEIVCDPHPGSMHAAIEVT